MNRARITGWDLWQWSQKARTEALTAQISPREVDGLLQAVTDLDHLALRLGSFKTSSQVELKMPWADFLGLWQRRLSERVPLQYLLGTVAWRHFSLVVSPAVLIPRPETELIIDLAVATITEENLGLSQGHWVDLGTGSGAIALGLAEGMPAAIIHAVDCSEAALDIAQHNARTLELSNRIQFYQGSWWEPLTRLQGQISGMVSNPPYIPNGLIPTLQPEVTRHEPHLALAGGEDGLGCIRHLINTAPSYLKSGGVWLVEMMAGQADEVIPLLQNQGNYTDVQVCLDLAGIERFALAYRL
ncbi:MAG: peptide chain release factor N(5)-glutamine methyltransferase [Microcoleaceae cyanobacterium]